LGIDIAVFTRSVRVMATAHKYDEDLPGYDEQHAQIVELTEDEWYTMFDARAREWLGMSGEEFIRRLKAGEIEDPDRTPVVKLALMMLELED
jgi:hypothetical protein